MSGRFGQSFHTPRILNKPRFYNLAYELFAPVKAVPKFLPVEDFLTTSGLRRPELMVAVQGGRYLSRAKTINRLAALRSADGIDLAIGLIKDWQADNRVAVIRSPDVNTELVRCLVIGDVRLEIDD